MGLESQPWPGHPHQTELWSIQISNLRGQGESQDVATNSPTAATPLSERLMQTLGEGDGFFPFHTVRGADAGERFWASLSVKYECVYETVVHKVLEFQ